MKIHQHGIMPIEEIVKHKNWFEYVFNEASPSRSTFRCRLCFNYYDKFGLENRYKSALANEEGTLKSDKYENKKAIREHATIPGHQTVIQVLQEKNAKR